MTTKKTLEQLWEEHIKISNKDKRKVRSFMRRLSQSFNLPEKLFNVFEKHLKK